MARGSETTGWDLRLADVCAAYGEEYERLSDAYDADWKAAYCAEFRRFAAERGWPIDAIESGWLDDLPDQAMAYYRRGADPARCARRDVPECEEPADAN